MCGPHTKKPLFQRQNEKQKTLKDGSRIEAAILSQTNYFLVLSVIPTVSFLTMSFQTTSFQGLFPYRCFLISKGKSSGYQRLHLGKHICNTYGSQQLRELIIKKLSCLKTDRCKERERVSHILLVFSVTPFKIDQNTGKKQNRSID